MSLDRILIAGLGNPGPEYRGTWHNLGFRALEKLAAEFKVDFIAGKGEFLYARARFADREVMLMKPTSFMNLSGQPILMVVESEDFFHENIFVVCDDINLPLSRIRIRAKGSDGGHKGLASTIYYLGTEEFPRLRLGISTKENYDSLKNYVLSEIPQKTAEEVDVMLERSVEATKCFIREGLDKTMTRFNKAEEPSLQE